MDAMDIDPDGRKYLCPPPGFFEALADFPDYDDLPPKHKTVQHKAHKHLICLPQREELERNKLFAKHTKELEEFYAKLPEQWDPDTVEYAVSSGRPAESMCLLPSTKALLNTTISTNSSMDLSSIKAAICTLIPTNTPSDDKLSLNELTLRLGAVAVSLRSSMVEEYEALRFRQLEERNYLHKMLKEELGGMDRVPRMPAREVRDVGVGQQGVEQQPAVQRPAQGLRLDTTAPPSSIPLKRGISPSVANAPRIPPALRTENDHALSPVALHRHPLEFPGYACEHYRNYGSCRHREECVRALKIEKEERSMSPQYSYGDGPGMHLSRERNLREDYHSERFMQPNTGPTVTRNSIRPPREGDRSNYSVKPVVAPRATSPPGIKTPVVSPAANTVLANRLPAPAHNTGGESTQTSTRVLFVGNLPFETKETDLREHFGKAGAIQHVNIPKNKQSRGYTIYAFVYFETTEAVTRALSMHDLGDFWGRKLRLQYGRMKDIPNQGERAAAMAEGGAGGTAILNQSDPLPEVSTSHTDEEAHRQKPREGREVDLWSVFTRINIIADQCAVILPLVGAQVELFAQGKVPFASVIREAFNALPFPAMSHPVDYKGIGEFMTWVNLPTTYPLVQVVGMAMGPLLLAGKLSLQGASSVMASAHKLCCEIEEQGRVLPSVEEMRPRTIMGGAVEVKSYEKARDPRLNP
ncbi:hypothetical protein SAICODRAFT_7289 [Saitoella complicata NRRL Y-17804]|uniref:RRM domain-containing protein n=1 Tax=Saitoella complicata (strain BCRC 22490 / CBS 7301 / JCM 7358 / NBRC 10748 / NRRL Y-17804) TaxID=698492 RepID=A0A0E9N8X4_SAICN|nr:uncharacterized protein SAICODRAFT_7289 [Saitoella complicata NRRL Y-17804]ODQ53132.1 hypothetical protein SAICODRAFT_7289 [Saitoella complicata NRRL Y-17804]GAO46253.1 hypothetical protein G7K_0488-t1 [Saitoella complicata NRRL Y-17804]